MLKHFQFFLIACLLAFFSMAAESLHAQEATAEKEEKAPVTTSDPYMAVDELRLVLMAFTKEELLIEADSWQQLLRKKAIEIAEAEIAIKRQNIEVTNAGDIRESAHEVDVAAKKADEETETVEENGGATGVMQGDESHTDVMPSADKAEGGKKETKEDLLEKVNELREERTLILDNYKAVIDALIAKTDESDSGTRTKIEDYQLYAKSVQGFHLDVTDTTSSWIAIKGWLMSEEGGLRFSLNFLRFVAIVVFTWMFARFLGGVTKRALGMTDKVSMLLENFLSGAVRWITMAIGGIMALSALEVSVAPLLAVVGAAGFVIAFALQDSLSNFASGIMILFFRPFDVGDLIEAGGVSGKVTTMNLVSTTIMTPDNKKMVVPNNKIWQDVITNATGVRNRRIDMVFGIGYEDDIDKAKEIFSEILNNHKQVLKDPEPNIRVHTLADSSVNFICRPWVRSEDYWDVYWDITEAVKKRLDAAGISIPFPQQDVHLFVQKDEEQEKA